MPKRALITGVTGQDGAYLAEFLLAKGYEVHGIKRRASLFNTARIDHLYQDPHDQPRNFVLHHGDMTDSCSLIRIVQSVQPDEITTCGAEPRRRVVRGTGIHRQRRRPGHAAPAGSDPHPEAGRQVALLPGLDLRAVRPGAGNAAARDARSSPQPLRRRQALRLLDQRELPRSLRHVACNGILFNHESPKRGETFACARSRAAWRASCWACRNACTWATCPPCAIGATRATTWKCSG